MDTLRSGRAGPHRNRRRVTAVLAVVLLVTLDVAGQSSSDRVTVLGPRGRQFIPVSVFADVSMIPLDELASYVRGRVRSETESANFSVGERSASVFSGLSLVPVGGRKILLSAPVTVRGGRWFVPLDFLGRVLPLLTEEKVTYRDDERLLVLGESFPRLDVRSMAYPAYTRVVLESTGSTDFQVNQLSTRIQVLIPAPYIETDFQGQEIRDGVVEKLSLERRADTYVFTVDLGERFGTLKATELENPKRLVLDLFRSRVPTGVETPPIPEEGEELPPPEPIPVPTTPPEPEPTDIESQPVGDLRIITLDPGHGGAETGAMGPSGLMEKNVTLSIARRLRTLLENRLGVEVVFTRDGDRNIPLDERTEIANNNKSDLFISIHANASRRSNARGSSVYFLSYQASDEESRRVAAAENAQYNRTAVDREDRDLEFILWDMAQAAYLNESAIFAEILLEELVGSADGGNNRGIKQAPFRVLMGATMPAVLLEVAFITNAEEERLLKTEEYQDQLAESIYRGVLRYKERYERRLGMNETSAVREKQ
jgi:N-acetylmuramoyl-L-alanine amidase